MIELTISCLFVGLLIGYIGGRVEGKGKCEIEKVALTKSILDRKNFGHNWITRFRR